MNAFHKVFEIVALQPRLTKRYCEDQVRVWCAKLVRDINSILFSAKRFSRGGLTQTTHEILMRRLDFSVDHFEVEAFHFFYVFKIPLQLLRKSKFLKILISSEFLKLQSGLPKIYSEFPHKRE